MYRVTVYSTIVVILWVFARNDYCISPIQVSKSELSEWVNFIKKNDHREECNGDSRFCAFFMNLIIGLSQFATIILCLVGWCWSIGWGITLISVSSKLSIQSTLVIVNFLVREHLFTIDGCSLFMKKMPNWSLEKFII